MQGASQAIFACPGFTVERDGDVRERPAQEISTQGAPISHVARELDVHPETLRSWVRRYEREHGKQVGPLEIDERARLKELERRNRELEMEVAFLKKAAAYFAKDPR